MSKTATRTKRTTRYQGVEDSNANEKDNTLPRWWRQQRERKEHVTTLTKRANERKEHVTNRRRQHHELKGQRVTNWRRQHHERKGQHVTKLAKSAPRSKKGGGRGQATKSGGGESYWNKTMNEVNQTLKTAWHQSPLRPKANLLCQKLTVMVVMAFLLAYEDWGGGEFLGNQSPLAPLFTYFLFVFKLNL